MYYTIIARVQYYVVTSDNPTSILAGDLSVSFTVRPTIFYSGKTVCNVEMLNGLEKPPYTYVCISE